jgi:N-sulfoglucosamine sulfohydrolase
MLEDYVNYLKAIELFDKDVGQVLKRIEYDGLLESSIIILGSDHGECLFRSKQFLYDGGLHIPLIIRWPDNRHAGDVDDQRVSGIDISTTVLKLAGLPSG